MVQMRSAFKPACDWAIPLAQVNGRPQLSKAEDCDCSKWGILSSHSDAFEALNMDVRVSVLGRIGQRNLVGFMDDVFFVMESSGGLDKISITYGDRVANRKYIISEGRSSSWLCLFCCRVYFTRGRVRCRIPYHVLRIYPPHTCFCCIPLGPGFSNRSVVLRIYIKMQCWLAVTNDHVKLWR